MGSGEVPERPATNVLKSFSRENALICAASSPRTSQVVPQIVASSEPHRQVASKILGHPSRKATSGARVDGITWRAGIPPSTSIGVDSQIHCGVFGDGMGKRSKCQSNFGPLLLCTCSLVIRFVLTATAWGRRGAHDFGFVELADLLTITELGAIAP